MECRICATASQPLARARILFKHDISYFRCPACGFVQTERPYWLKESYAEAINRSDIGVVRRSIDLGRMLRIMLPLIADPGGRFVDYGGGYGMLVRLMRDEGYDFRWYDAYCENLFAQDFEAERRGGYEMLTAFEVFEHLENPREGLQEMLGFSDVILLSTYLLPEPCPLPDEWWYYGMDHGQHISLYSRAALEKLAADAGARLYTNGQNMHLITRRPVSNRRFQFALHRRAALLAPLFRRPSLLQRDFSHSIEQLSRKAAKP